jgi:hypothetical protein
MRTRFFCSCGYTFAAKEVESALSSISLIRSRLLREIEAMNQSEMKIARQSQSSFEVWLRDIGLDIGRDLGVAAGKVMRWLDELF